MVTATFADGQLTDAIKQLATDPTTDQKVKKKLVAVLASWNSQFKDDPSMSVVAGLYRQCRPADRRTHGHSNSADLSHGPSSDYERKMKEKDEKELAKQRAKREKEEAKERARKADEEARKQKRKPRRAPFNFEVVRNIYLRHG